MRFKLGYIFAAVATAVILGALGNGLVNLCLIGITKVAG